MSELSSNDSERLAKVIDAMQEMEPVVDRFLDFVKELARFLGGQWMMMPEVVQTRLEPKAREHLEASAELFIPPIGEINRAIETATEGEDEPTAGPIDA